MLSSNTSAVSGDTTYIEDVFSTYLYTGTGATLSINNSIDLSTKGGMVWFKNRNGALDHAVFDTARGVTKSLRPNDTVAEATETGGLTAFNTNGFTIGNWSRVNYTTSDTYASWTFRKQPKFFDIQTYTGNGGGGYVFNHNLQSRPGFIIIKAVGASSNWFVWHRGTSVDSTTNALSGFALNSTSQSTDAQPAYGVTDTVVNVYYIHDQSGNIPNDSGVTYVAYLFAHNAGGFGLTGTDNVISCGSFTTNGSGAATVTLGYEPQFVMWKASSTTSDWYMMDTMRGFAVAGAANDRYLRANLANSENGPSTFGGPTATGFAVENMTPSASCIYIAIRRGPMKVPTDATKVFIPVANTVSADNTVATTNFPVDLIMSKVRTTAERWWWFDKLRGTYATGPSANLSSNAAYAEGSITSNGYGLDSNTTFVDNFQYYWNGTSRTFINYAFRRAPSFFDEVCYTGNSASSGTGNTQLITHNLGVAPEMIVVKRRSGSSDWIVWTSALSATQYLFFDGSAVMSANPTYFFGTTGPTPSSTQFKVGDAYYTNASGSTYVAYLFATCPGVSKVGSYTGNGTLRTIDCGFTGGARFALIKNITTGGDWMVWDTARGMVAGTDYEQAWSTDGSQTNANSVYTITTGFQLLASPAFDVNTSGQTYIYLAIA